MRILSARAAVRARERQSIKRGASTEKQPSSTPYPPPFYTAGG